jgi:hypothetical protein
MEKSKTITLDFNNLKLIASGAFEITISGKELEDFESMSEEKKYEYMEQFGCLEVDHQEIYESGKLSNLKYYE